MHKIPYNHVKISGILFTVIIFVWPVFMALSAPQGTLEDQINHLRDDAALFRLSFALAALIAPLLFYLILSVIRKAGEPLTLTQHTGLIFTGIYTVLATISYTSQLSLVPALLHDQSDLLGLFYFFNPHSIPYYLNQLGYSSFGVGVLLLFAGKLKTVGAQRWFALLFVLSGALSIIAFMGLLVDSQVINGLTLPAGLLLLPCGILASRL